MAKTYHEATSVESIAQGLIGNYHQELANARMMYVFVDKASKKGGKELLGKAQKVAGVWEWAVEKDFIITVPYDRWNELTDNQKTALVDHLLERCTGEEDKNGEMKWTVREPDIQEFGNILQRHGAWHRDLEHFVLVAHDVNIDHIVQEEAEIDLAEESVEVTQSE